MRETRILIVDDHTVSRKGIESILSDIPGFKVVGEASDGLAALECAQRLKPDVIIMDISMPVLNGIEASRCIVEKLPKIKVIILSMHQNQRYAVESFQAGAAGYVLKGADSDELIAAIGKVLSGKRYVSPAVADELLSEHIFKKDATPDLFDTLSGREKEVLKLIAEGASSKDIAARLCISLHTVNKHRANIVKKLKIHDLPGLVKIAIKKGLIKNPA